MRSDPKVFYSAWRGEGAMTLSREYWRGKYHCTVDLLFDWWFGLVCFANKNKNCQLSYSQFQTSQTGGQWYSDTYPFSIPCTEHSDSTCLGHLGWFDKYRNDPTSVAPPKEARASTVMCHCCWNNRQWKQAFEQQASIFVIWWNGKLTESSRTIFMDCQCWRNFFFNQRTRRRLYQWPPWQVQLSSRRHCQLPTVCLPGA